MFSYVVFRYMVFRYLVLVMTCLKFCNDQGRIFQISYVFALQVFRSRKCDRCRPLYQYKIVFDSVPPRDEVSFGSFFVYCNIELIQFQDIFEWAA